MDNRALETGLKTHIFTIECRFRVKYTCMPLLDYHKIYLTLRGRIKRNGSHCKRATATGSMCFPLMFDTCTGPGLFDTCPGKPHCSWFVQLLSRSFVNVKSRSISHRSVEKVAKQSVVQINS